MAWFRVPKSTMNLFLKNILKVEIDGISIDDHYIQNQILKQQRQNDVKIGWILLDSLPGIKPIYIIDIKEFNETEKWWGFYEREDPEGEKLWIIANSQSESLGGPGRPIRPPVESPEAPKEVIERLYPTNNNKKIEGKDEMTKTPEQIAEEQAETLNYIKSIGGLEAVKNAGLKCNKVVIDKIGKKRAGGLSLQDFEAAISSLHYCEAYNPEIAFDNATSLLYQNLEEDDADTVNEIREYLKYVIDTDKKNRAKGCRPFAKWKYKRDYLDVDANPYNPTGEAEDVEFTQLKESLKTSFDAYENSDHESELSGVSFRTFVSRALDEMEANRNEADTKKHKTWYQLSKDRKSVVKVKKPMLKKFNKIVGDRSFMMLGGNTIHKKSETGYEDQDVNDFILANHDKDNFDEVVEDIIKDF
jgi:hypothetical protein